MGKNLQAADVIKMRDIKKQTNIITQNLIISDASIASNAELIKFTKITHIINLSTKKVDNFFAEKQRDK